MPEREFIVLNNSSYKPQNQQPLSDAINMVNKAAPIPNCPACFEMPEPRLENAPPRLNASAPVAKNSATAPMIRGKRYLSFMIRKKFMAFLLDLKLDLKIFLYTIIPHFL